MYCKDQQIQDCPFINSAFREDASWIKEWLIANRKLKPKTIVYTGDDIKVNVWLDMLQRKVRFKYLKLVDHNPKFKDHIANG